MIVKEIDQPIMDVIRQV